MRARKPKPGVTRLSRLARRWRFDRNPLRRGTDRAESALLALLVAAFLIGAPFAALATGAWFHDTARQEQLAQESLRRQVTAVVLAVASPAVADGDLIWQAQARWKAPNGQLVTQEVPVPSGTAAGGKIQVWTDRTGDLTSAPLLDSQVADEVPFGEVIGTITLAAVLTVAGGLAWWALNKRRMAAWDADWHATGPRWTTHA